MHIWLCVYRGGGGVEVCGLGPFDFFHHGVPNFIRWNRLAHTCGSAHLDENSVAGAAYPQAHLRPEVGLGCCTISQYVPARLSLPNWIARHSLLTGRVHTMAQMSTKSLAISSQGESTSPAVTQHLSCKHHVSPS